MTDQQPNTITCRDCTRPVHPAPDVSRFIWVCHCGWRYGDRNQATT